MAQLDAFPTADQEVAGATPYGSGIFDHEIFPTGYYLPSLFQEGQLSVSGERMCTILDNRSEDCPVKVWLGKQTALDMTTLG